MQKYFDLLDRLLWTHDTDGPQPLSKSDLRKIMRISLDFEFDAGPEADYIIRQWEAQRDKDDAETSGKNVLGVLRLRMMAHNWHYQKSNNAETWREGQRTFNKILASLAEAELCGLAEEAKAIYLMERPQ